MGRNQRKLLKAAGEAAVPPIVTYIGFTDDIATRSYYTFSATPIGTASADRLVVVAVHLTDYIATALSSVTIGGVTASIDVAPIFNGNKGVVGLASLIVAAGTTATIGVNTAGGPARGCSIAVHTITGLASGTAKATASASVVFPPVSTTINVGVNDALIVAMSSDSNDAYISAGVVESYNQFGDGKSRAGGFLVAIAAETPRTVSATDLSGDDIAIAAATWE